MSPRLKRNLKSAGFVTLITLLIWLYAEGQNVQELPARKLLLEPPPRVGQNTVVVFADTDGPAEVNVVFRGASASLTELRDHLYSGSTIAMPLEPTDIRETGSEFSVPLRPLLARLHTNPRNPNAPTVGELGINIASLEPAEIDLFADTLVQQSVPVRFDPPDVTLGPSVTIDPPQVTVTLPQTLLNALEGRADALYAEARLPDNLDLAQMDQSPTQPIPMRVRLDYPEFSDLRLSRLTRFITLQQNTVDVSFTIVGRRETHQITSVPVWLISPPSELERFNVTLDPISRVLPEVRITGPGELIQRFAAPDSPLTVVARLELTGEEMETGLTSKPLSAIEIREADNGLSRVLHVIPLNPRALRSGAPPDTPTFVADRLTAITPEPTVRFTIERR